MCTLLFNQVGVDKFKYANLTLRSPQLTNLSFLVKFTRTHMTPPIKQSTQQQSPSAGGSRGSGPPNRNIYCTYPLPAGARQPHAPSGPRPARPSPGPPPAELLHPLPQRSPHLPPFRTVTSPPRLKLAHVTRAPATEGKRRRLLLPPPPRAK